MPQPPRRSKYIDQAVVAALRDIEILQAAIVAHDFARRVVVNRHFGYGSEYTPDDRMRQELYRLKSDAQSRALMFGSLTLNDELRKESLKAATEFIMRDNASIMGYLTVEGVPPSSYLVEVNDDFRAEIHAAVREQLGIDPAAELRRLYGPLDADDDHDENDDSDEDDTVKDED